MSAPATGPRAGWGAGARVAGLVVALGYLLGLVRGPVVAVVGGLALVTLGRCAFSDPHDDLALGASLAVLAGALGVGALRWGALDLGDLRGAQAVLGPTVLVGPAGVAAACWAGAVAALTALASWLATARHADEGDPAALGRALWVAEAVVGSFAIVSVFWGPSVARDSVAGVGGIGALLAWLVAVALATAGALGGAVLLIRRPPVWRWAGLAASGAAALVAAVAVARTVA